MTLTKVQQRFCLLSVFSLSLSIIFILCLNLLFQQHEQSQNDQEKTLRIRTLQNSLQGSPAELLPSKNILEHLKYCGGEKLTKLAQDKSLTCELNCNYQYLLLFLKKYVEYPAADLQSLHIAKNTELLISISLSNPTGTNL